MEMILLETLSSILPTYMKHAKMRKLFLVHLYVLFVFRSQLHGGKKQNTQLHRVGVNLKEKIKGKARGVTREVSKNFMYLCFDLKNTCKYNNR